LHLTGARKERQEGAQAGRKRFAVRPSFAIFGLRDAGWSSLVARRAHNPKVAGSNPAPAIRKSPAQAGFFRGRGRTAEAVCVPILFQFHLERAPPRLRGETHGG